MKRFNFKKCLSLLVALTMMLCMGISASAFEANTMSEGNYIKSSSRAISGSGSITVDGSGSFTIYSPDWSLFGHATIVVSGASASNPVLVTLKRPTGQIIGEYQQKYTQNGTYNLNITNAKAGTYTVEVTTVSAVATVSVYLGDLYA